MTSPTSPTVLPSLQQSQPSCDAHMPNATTVEDFLIVGFAASKILSHFTPEQKKELRRMSKTFKHAVDRTITCFKYNDDYVDRSLDVLLRAPWDIQRIECSFYRSRDDPPPTYSLTQHFDRWKNLRDLSIHEPRPADIVLLGSCNLEGLTSLYMNNFKFDANSVEQLSNAPWWPRIRKLDISMWQDGQHASFQQALHKEFCRRVAPLLVNLGELGVGQSEGQEYAACLFSCSGFPRLRSIDCNDMADDDAAAFGQLHLPSLEHVSVCMINPENTCEDICKCNAVLKSLQLENVSRLDLKLIAKAVWANTLTLLDLYQIPNLLCSMQGTFELRSLKELTILPYYNPTHGKDSLEIFSKARLPALTNLRMFEGESSFGESDRPCDLSSLLHARWFCQLQTLEIHAYEHQDDELIELVRHGAFDALRRFDVCVLWLAGESFPVLRSAGRGRFKALQSLSMNIDYCQDFWNNLEEGDWEALIFNEWTEKAPQNT